MPILRLIYALVIGFNAIPIWNSLFVDDLRHQTRSIQNDKFILKYLTHQASSTAQSYSDRGELDKALNHWNKCYIFGRIDYHDISQQCLSKAMVVLLTMNQTDDVRLRNQYIETTSLCLNWVFDIFDINIQDLSISYVSEIVNVNNLSKFNKTLILQSMVILYRLGEIHYRFHSYLLSVSYFDIILPFYDIFTIDDLKFADLSSVDEVYYLMGLSYQRAGDIIKSHRSYWLALKNNRNHVGARLNLAVLLQENQQFSDASFHYEYLIDLLTRDGITQNFTVLEEKKELSMALFNEMMLHYQSSDLYSAKVSANNYIRHISSSCREDSEINCLDLMMGKAAQMIIHRRSCYWRDWEVNYDLLVNAAVKRMLLNESELKILLPFDTLMLSIPLDIKLHIAIGDKFGLLTNDSKRAEHDQVKMKFENSQSLCQVNGQLTLGFISYDFNDHPTSHLIEGLLKGLQRAHVINDLTKVPNLSPYDVKVYAYCYGSHDNSTYRRRIESSVDKFYDMKTFSHQAISHIIRKDQVDILLDLQVHTLGNRMEILAHRPSPIQINYLVYPGTSGSYVLDYIIVDPIVVPPEQSYHYSEAMVYLSPTYQVSYYNQYSIESEPDMLYNKDDSYVLDSLHDNHIILCAFNKIDKLEPSIFHNWMNILRSLPSSILLLLNPGKHSSDWMSYHQVNQPQDVSAYNIYQMAAMYGIVPNRIFFLPRVEKQKHIRRQRICHLFLDTVVYGAHSTATDSIRGAVPFITVLGDSFASRVGSSLYESFFADSTNSTNTEEIKNILQSDSIKEYENTVLKVFSVKAYADESMERLEYPIITSAKRTMTEWVEKNLGLFQVDNYTRKFIQAMIAISEIKSIYRRNSSTSVNGRLCHLITITD